MGTKIFVGNLSNLATQEMVSELFAAHGAVKKCDILSGFGFVVSSTLARRT